jgi:hypothetical protein
MRPLILVGLCTVLAGVGLAAAPADEVAVSGGLVTLYHHDPLSRTVSFGTGEHGTTIQDHEVRNLESDLDFGHYQADAFSVGIEGGRVGAIIDLGTLAELQERYGYEETVGGGQGFASIRREDGRLVILDGRDGQRTQPLAEGDALFGEATKSSHAPIRDRHVYLVRLRDRHEPRFERLVKFLVVQYEPGVSVTLRWQLIDSGAG